MKITAKRRFRYPLIGGKIYNPGDSFDAKKMDAKLLVRVGKADYATREPQELPPPPPDVASAIGPIKAAQRAEEEKDRLRAEAEALDVDVDGRWGVARLEEEIAAAKEKGHSSPAESAHEQSEADEEKPSEA